VPDGFGQSGKRGGVGSFKSTVRSAKARSRRVILRREAVAVVLRRKGRGGHPEAQSAERIAFAPRL